ncbi:hypothetical protein AL07_11475, partial [Corynebacterium diphtheriae bv. gravis str. ISS 4060]
MVMEVGSTTPRASTLNISDRVKWLFDTGVRNMLWMSDI